MTVLKKNDTPLCLHSQILDAISRAVLLCTVICTVHTQTRSRFTRSPVWTLERSEARPTRRAAEVSVACSVLVPKGWADVHREGVRDE